MREIKFRAYDKYRKEYLSAGQIYLSIQPGSHPAPSKQYLDVISNPNAYANRFVIEPFTSLKDKNGTEIYEGDIIEIEIPMTHPHGAILATFTAVAEWVNDGFYAMEIGVTDPVLRSLYGHSGTHCRVIGNIHDNPELVSKN